MQLIEILVTERDADWNEPGSLQGAQVGQGEIPVGSGADVVDWLAIVDGQQDMQALWPVAQFGFNLVQAPVKVFFARPVYLAGNPRFSRFVVVCREWDDFGHRLLDRDAVGRHGRVATVEIVFAEVSHADWDANLHGGQVYSHQCLTHDLLEMVY